MPKKRGRKPRATHRSHLHPAAAEAPQKPSMMMEAEEPRSPSPSRSRSHSPSPSQPPDQQPERQQQVEAQEVSEGPPQGTRAEAQERPPQDAEAQESRGADASPPRVAPSTHDPRAPNASVQRRPHGKRAKPLSDKQRAAIQEKLDLLEKNLRPVPFAPGKAIDFTGHERLFRALGLWEFAHADLGGPVRADLLGELIANYEPQQRRSWVNGARVAVSRPDLARALGLQVKKEKGSLSENKDADNVPFSCEDSISVIMDFMSNWVLFHEEDACIPVEVVTATQLVREGQPQKVDWSALVWTMVEKELQEVPTSGVCYYASHLQCLMRHQKPGIFEGEDQDVMEVSLAEEEDAHIAAVVATDTLQDSGVLDTEKQGAELCLGIGGDGSILKDDIGECQENEQDQWFHETKNVEGEHYLRRCNQNDVQSMESEDVVGEEVGMGEEGHYVDDITAKLSNLDKMTSTGILQAMETGNVSYLPLQPMEPSTGEFLVSKTDPLKGVELDTCMAGPSLFKMAGKREIDEVGDDDEGDDITHFSHGNHQKRMRTDGQWDQTPLTVDKCVDEAHNWMEKAKQLSSRRDQEFVSEQMHIQYMNTLLQQRDHQIQLLAKTRLEEQHSRQMEICRFEHELAVMARIVQGYRKALLETRRAFTEYRKQFPQGDEQLYKDDDDGGGLVLTTKELERKRLHKEEEKRLAMQMIEDFCGKWSEKFNDYEDQVHQLDKKLLDLMGEINVLKERRAKNNVSAEKDAVLR